VAGTVHSVFDHAVNHSIDGRDGLIGLIKNDRPLTPHAASLPTDDLLTRYDIRTGMAVTLAEGNIQIPGAGIEIDFSGSGRKDLSVDTITVRRCSATDSLPVLREALRDVEIEFGVSALATGKTGNVYSDFLKSRFLELADAVSAGDEARALHAAGRMSGCGVGLTPSSDDLLTGYFTMLRVLWRAQNKQGNDALLLKMAKRAAAKTNRISATFLLQSGEGLANEAVLSLVGPVFSDTDDETLRRAAARVMSIGSTSGGDMLTGMILAIAHHDGGK
jgi:hypothetical protein